eukprot:scaffold3819_cov107-Isochrysis_galbana.AAC.9
MAATCQNANSSASSTLALHPKMKRSIVENGRNNMGMNERSRRRRAGDAHTEESRAESSG